MLDEIFTHCSIGVQASSDEKANHNPETGDWADHEVAYSDGVVVHMAGAKRMFISGAVANGEDIETQARNVLEQIEDMVTGYNGGMESQAHAPVRPVSERER